MKLISMTDFVLEHPATTDYEWQLSKHLKYANFLKQPLTLGMFIPCDEHGNVLEEPTNYDTWLRIYSKDKNSIVGFKEHEEYCKAKERVLFEGFRYKSNYSEKLNKLYEYVTNGHHVFSFEQIKNGIVEGLLTGYKEQFRIKLTESAIKQIGL